MSASQDLLAAWRLRLSAPPIDSDTVGWIGLDTPVEAILACGLKPLRVTAPPASAGAEDFAEGAGNPVLRGLASALIEGPYRGLERLVISPTPAAHKWLFNFLTDLKRQGEGPEKLEIYLFDLNHGAAPGLDAVRRGSVERLVRRMEDWSGRSADLPAAIVSANRRRKQQHLVQGARVMRRLTGAEALAAFEAEDLASLLLSEVGVRAELPGQATIYSGSATYGPQTYESIEGLIVADDQDSGSRAIMPLLAEDGDPLAVLAEGYLKRNPAPAKSTVDERLAYLTGLVKQTGARRVVFNISPYDHPAGWEAPFLKTALADRGIEVADV